MKHIDILIIGAGISGAVLAERYASIGKKVLIIEKRNHIAGNCYDYVNENGSLVSKYGAHLFHTNEESVWKYVNKFSEWDPWEYNEIVNQDNKTVPFSINIAMINELFGINITNEEEMKIWLEKNCIPIEKPSNGKESVLNIGSALYEKMYSGRYFSDTYQALPKGGFTQLFENILNHPNIEVLLETDYFDIKDQYTNYEKLFYTDPVDRFFKFTNNFSEKLEFRSIHFVSETFDVEFFQENAVANKHFENQASEKTTVVKESNVDGGKPCCQEADKLIDANFTEKKANYKYFNMDQAFKNALDLFNQLEKNNDSIYKTAG